MLTALILKDDATEVPRQVEDMAAARALLSGGMPVFILGEDGTKTPVTAEDAPVASAAEAQVDPAAEAPVEDRATDPEFPPAA